MNDKKYTHIRAEIVLTVEYLTDLPGPNKEPSLINAVLKDELTVQVQDMITLPKGLSIASLHINLKP